MKRGVSQAAWAIVALLFLCSCARVWAATGGSISGTVKDQSGAVIMGAAVTLVNLDLSTSYKTTTNAQGLYSFPDLPVGHYEITIESTGFTNPEKNRSER